MKFEKESNLSLGSLHKYLIGLLQESNELK